MDTPKTKNNYYAPCRHCGELMDMSLRKRRYCDVVCCQAYNDQVQRARARALKGTRLPRRCKVCNKTFTPTHGNQRSCPDRCRLIAGKQVGSKWRGNTTHDRDRNSRAS